MIFLSNRQLLMAAAVQTPAKVGDPTPTKSGPKQLKIGRYVFGETLGHGSFGKVKMANHELTGHKVAVKILNRQKIQSLDVAEKIRREIQILKMFRHPHIIKLYEVITTPTDIFMIMEYVSGGELFDYIVKHGKSSEPNARKFFQQIISGVDYCHRHKVVHRDLKPENLLLDSQNHVRIADFGLSNLMKDGELLQTSCGSPNYAAPEVVSGNLYAGPEVDVWSCGIILYALLCGSLPFDDKNVSMLFKKIKNGQFYIPNHLSGEVVDLLTKMLQVNPVKRITIQQIREHEWFKQDVPEYLFPPLGETNHAQIDSSALAEVCQKLSVPPQEVVMAIRSGDHHNELSIAYHLVLDNRIFQSHASFPEAIHLATSPPKSSFTTRDLFIGTEDRAVAMATTEPSDVADEHRVAKVTPYYHHHHQQQKRSKWHLGIRSQSRPQDIMAEIFRKLQALNFKWKIVSHYFVRCCQVNPVSGVSAKVDLQLYQIDQKNFLLDFKCVSQPDESSDEDGDGDQTHQKHLTIEFFEICSQLISALAQ